MLERHTLRRQLTPEKLVRQLRQDARTVAGQSVGADRAAVTQIVERRKRVLQNGVRLAPVRIGDEADAASVSLFGPGQGSEVGPRQAARGYSSGFHRGGAPFVRRLLRRGD